MHASKLQNKLRKLIHPKENTLLLNEEMGYDEKNFPSSLKKKDILLTWLQEMRTLQRPQLNSRKIFTIFA